MTRSVGRAAGALAAIAAVAGAFWLGISLLDSARAGGIPGGAAVRRLNRGLGQWLLNRSTPLPDCPDDAAVAAAAEEARAAAAEKRREGVEGLYRWTDEKGVTHFTDELERVPERKRAGSRVESLPLLTVYHGEYSRLPRAAATRPAAKLRAPAAGAAAQAVLYSAAWCGACKKTQAWLADQGVSVEERDIDRDPRALAELVAIAGPNPSIPVTVIGGRAVGGFAPAELRQALAAIGR